MLERDAPRSVMVIIDAFRAFATAPFILDRGPADYFAGRPAWMAAIDSAA